MARNITFHEDPKPVSQLATREMLATEFARRLQHIMVQKGWNQSELARRATEQMTSGEIGRDVISVYIRGKSVPGPERLSALAKALGVERSELMPSVGITAASRVDPPVDVRDIGEGKVWLRINQAVDWPSALKILEILKGND